MNRRWMVLLALVGLCAPLAADEVEPPQAAIARGEPDKPEFGFAVGKRLPLLVVDFVNPTGYGHCGCVSVMLRNRKARGVVVLTRSLDESVIELCRRLEKEELIGGETLGYLVVFERSVASLKEPAAQWGLTKFTVNAARHDAAYFSKQVSLPAETDTAVCTINVSPIAYAWSSDVGKLTAKQQSEIVAAVKELNAQPVKLPVANDVAK
jgi:hypothetical protein